MKNATRDGKKRKSGSQELEADRTLYSSFVHAANAVSQLYTAAAQQSKRSEEAGARQALERVAQFVVKEYGNAPAVPTGVLMEVLRQELQAAQGSTAAIQLPFPVPLLLPTGSDASDAHSDDEHLMSADGPSPAGFRRSASGHHISPPKGRGAPGQLPAMFHQQQQHAMQQQHHQQQQQQQLHHQQQQMQQHQQHLAMQQQQQQQQQQGFMPGFGGQPPFQ